MPKLYELPENKNIKLFIGDKTIIFGHYTKITHAIKELQQENKQLKVQLLEKRCSDKDIEYKKRLKIENNWNKLKEYLKSYIKLMNDKPDMIEQGQIDILYEVKDMMQELEDK